MNCPKCGSDDLIPYETKPPHNKGQQHKCTPECIQPGLFCRRCHYFHPKR